MDPSNSNTALASHPMMAAASDATAPTIILLLEELLDHSIRLRDSYRSARGLSAASSIQHLRQIFDEHYQEQRRLVDVLVDRVRMLGGAARVFASDFLRSSPSPFTLRGHHARSQLLWALLDAHDSILSVARPGASDDAPKRASIRDFAVGQVVLVNELQVRTLGDILARGSDDPRVTMPKETAAD
jgi:starvation-inducible DNA-binding protein